MNKVTSGRVATIAGSLAHIDIDTLRARANGVSTVQVLVDEIQALAGSALSQVGTPGQTEPINFLDRLNEEHDQLSSRILKLTRFLGMGASGASDAQRDLLEVQLMTMSVYKRVLELRLGDLNSEENRGTFSDHKTTAVASEREQPIGEAVEVGGHDEDRDGPVPFDV